MTILRDLSIIWSLFHILILFLMLYRSRYSRKKTYILTGISMGILIVINVTGLILYGADIMGKIFILTCTIPSLIFFWLISKDRKARFFFTFCMADTVALWIIVVTNVADYYFGKEQYILMFIGRLLLFPLVEWIAFRYIRKSYMELQAAVSHGWGIFAVMTALYYILIDVISNFPAIITSREQELPAFLLVLVLMPMTYATMFASLYRQLLLYRKQQNEYILIEQKNMLEAQLDNQQSIRRMKHDMKGYAATLSGLLAEGKTKEALSYLKGVETKMDIQSGQFCANPYINGVLVHYAGKFEKIAAEFSTDILLGEEQLPYMELCQILSNGLENAYDALKGISIEKRKASVQMKYNRNYLLIRIKNCCRDDLYVEKGTIPHTDKEGRDHGFGLATVSECAERLDGEMLCYTDNKNFVLDVMVSRGAF